MYDLHNHMLPGLDDGARDWKEALDMARMAWEDGIEEVVCTPHWMPGCYESSRAVILAALETLRSKLLDEGVPLRVCPGAELRLEYDLPQRVASGELLTLNDTGRYALVELPSIVLPERVESVFWDFQANGITPVISHPERNFLLLRNPMRLHEWVARGILLQITGASLLGHFGPEIQKFSILLLEHQMVHIVASDAHGPHHRSPNLSRAYGIIENMLGRDVAERLICETPRLIIKGEPVSVPDPEPIRPRASKFAFLKKIISRTKSGGA